VAKRKTPLSVGFPTATHSAKEVRHTTCHSFAARESRLGDTGATQQQNKKNNAGHRERQKIVCARTAEPPKLLIQKFPIGLSHEGSPLRISGQPYLKTLE